MNKLEALTEAVRLISYGGHDAVMIDYVEDRWRAWGTTNDVFPDAVGWSYDDGFDLPGITGRSRMFDQSEYLDTVAQFTYNMPELEEWLNDDSDDEIELAWTPVEDTSLIYEDGCFIDEDGDLTDDNIAGHMYGMIRYPA